MSSLSSLTSLPFFPFPAKRLPRMSDTESEQWRNFPPTRKRRSSYGMACTVCKLDHKACDGTRPCSRCVSLGSQASCKDVTPKKAGRPKKSRYGRPISHEISSGPRKPTSLPETIKADLANTERSASLLCYLREQKDDTLPLRKQLQQHAPPPPLQPPPRPSSPSLPQPPPQPSQTQPARKHSPVHPPLPTPITSTPTSRDIDTSPPDFPLELPPLKPRNNRIQSVLSPEPEPPTTTTTITTTTTTTTSNKRWRSLGRPYLFGGFTFDTTNAVVFDLPKHMIGSGKKIRVLSLLCSTSETLPSLPFVVKMWTDGDIRFTMGSARIIGSYSEERSFGVGHGMFFVQFDCHNSQQKEHPVHAEMQFYLVAVKDELQHSPSPTD